MALQHLRGPRLLVELFQRSPIAKFTLATLPALLIVLSPGHGFAAFTFSGDVSLNTAIPTGPVQVGRQSIGSVRLDNGSAFTSGPTQFGLNPTGIGSGLVTGERTFWSMTMADVGFAGIGRLDIQDGASVDILSTLRIGNTRGAHGTVTVDGEGSTLLARGLVTLGAPDAVAVLEISNGGVVSLPQTSLVTVASQSRVKLDGGLLRLGSLNNGGLIAGSGELSLMNIASNLNSGRLQAGTDDHLRIGGTSTGTFENQGAIIADGGAIEFSRLLNNSRIGNQSGGEITLRNGTLRVGTPPRSEAPLRNSGLIAAIGGENHVYGAIQNIGTNPLNMGEIAITNESVMIFHDDVNMQGGMMTVFPGSKATLLEDLSLSSGAILLADIAGSNLSTDYGEIEVVGNVQLGGQFLVTLSDGFTPRAGDSFQLLSAVGDIEGSLTLGDMPPLPDRLVWNLDITAKQVTLNVVPAPPGDYNANGIVDTADYVLWRKTLGQAGDGLAADGNGNGEVDADDYSFWRSRIGNVAGSAAGVSAVAAVPEPATIVLLCLGVATVASLSRMRKLHL